MLGQIGSGKIRIAVASYQFSSVAGNSCTYNLNCPNENANATCGLSNLVKPTPCGFYWMIDTRLAYKTATTKICFFLGAGVESSVPATCN